MACVSLFVVFVLSHLVLLHSAEEGKLENPHCWPFHCGKLDHISFPFTDIPPPPPFCGMQVKCDETPKHLPLGDWWNKRRYEVISISYYTNATKYIRVKNHWLLKYLNSKECHYLINFPLPPDTPFISFKLTTPNQTLFICNRDRHITSPRNFKNMACGDYNIFYSPSNEASQSLSSVCSTIQLPLNETSHEDDLKIIAEFDLELHVSDDCIRCHGEEGKGIDIGITQKCFDAHTCTCMNMEINSFIFFYAEVVPNTCVATISVPCHNPLCSNSFS